MQEINLKLSIDEANIILASLGQMPYQDVFQLITKIHQQANAQGQAPTPSNGKADDAKAEVVSEAINEN